MSPTGLLVFFSVAAFPGVLWLFFELWRDRRERKHGLAAKLALLPFWPIWGPLLYYRSGSLGSLGLGLALASLTAAAFPVLLFAWGAGNMVSYRDAMYAVEARLAKKEFDLAFGEVERIARSARNLAAIPVPLPDLDKLTALLSRHHVEAWLQVSHAVVAEDWERGRRDESAQKAEEAVRFVEKSLGRESDAYARALSMLASLRLKQGRLPETESLLAETLAVVEKLYGPAHPQTGFAVLPLARFYRDQKRYREALPLYRRLAQDTQAAKKRDSPAYQAFLRDLASVEALAAEQASPAAIP